MSYRIEGKDIVLTGFEQGIADSVYGGVADMRNMDILTVPGEASVSLGTTAATLPPVKNAVAFTAQNSGDTFTPTGGTSGFYQGVAIVLNTNTAGGLATGTVYYAFNITGTTFQLSVSPAGTTPVVISSDGSGTFTTYQWPQTSTAPVSYWVDKTGQFSGENGILLTDSDAHVWAMLSAAQASVPANSLIFLGNISGVAASGSKSTNGVVVWQGYVLLFGTSTAGVDVADLGDLWFSDGPAVAWDYTWENLATQSQNNAIQLLVAQEDGNLYFTSTSGLGSIIETPGDTFDPSDTASYTATDEALILPSTDEATCIAELGQNLLIGGRNAFVYVWNKIDPGFSNLLNMPDSYTTKIVATSNNAYVFAGIRGRIYITNGSGIDLFKKIPDYVTGALDAFFRWQDANFGRNQLYFTFTAFTAEPVSVTTVNGVWAIDLESNALRLINKTLSSGYAGVARMVTPRPPSTSGNPINTINGIVGENLAIGWGNGVSPAQNTATGIDISNSTPYSSYESYLETEIVPVGTLLDPFTPSQLEWKTAAPLVSGEGVRISYRTNITTSYTQMGESTTAGAISDMYKANFQKAQWVQFKVETKSTASSPSRTRLTEIRIRDWPSGKNMATR
jgi:hypothetical protein